MRILYLITKSESGGAQTHVFQLSKYFLEKGNSVAIMSYPGGWLESKVRELDGKFYSNKYLSNDLNPIAIINSVKKIQKTIEDFQPDLICCHSTITGFLGRIVVKNKIPIIFTAHGWVFTDGVSFLRKNIGIFMEKIAGRFCSKIICVSNFDKQLALKYKIVPEDKIVTIYNGVEVNPQEIKYEKNRIVFVGRLASPKNPLLLIRAFNNLSSNLKSQTTLSIVGDGQQKKRIKEFIKKNQLENKIELLGRLSRKATFDVLKKSNIFVLISDWEGFPYSILEAMSFGLAIVASDVGGVKESVENCGILLRKNDQKELKMTLEKLLKNPNLVKKMGEKAKKEVVKKFSLEKMLLKTEEVYKNI